MSHIRPIAAQPFIMVDRLARLAAFDNTVVQAIPEHLQPMREALQKWLECKDFILGLKCTQMGNFPFDSSSLHDCKVQINSLIDCGTYGNEKIDQQRMKMILHWHAALEMLPSMVEEIESQLDSPIIQLSKVGLKEKRKVLHHLQIIATPIASAYLGISIDALHKMKKYDDALFGGQYAGSHSYSIAEVEIIARNPHWSYGIHDDSLHKSTELSANELDQFLLVDEATAVAFTDMTSAALYATAPRTCFAQRPYRLSDLEKIRVQKLSQQLA